MMATFKDYSDSMLLQLLRQKESKAFEEIYARYWSKLYSVAFKRTQSREISEELVQDIFTSLWINKEASSIETLSAYLFTAIKYKVISHLQKQMTSRSFVNEQAQTAPAATNFTEEVVLHNDLNSALEREIQKLPPKRQMIFKLSRQHNFSTKQTALQLGISEKTVENQLGKAIKVLKFNLRHFNYIFFCVIVLISRHQ